jgi:flagellar basal body-associated protein FliL
MKKIQIIRHLTFLLLAAMLCAVVPVHQIFHKHHLVNSSTEKNSKTTQVKKAEKPCCKSFDSIQGNTLSTNVSVAANQPGSTIYTVNFFARFIKPFLQLSNKAPPISLA